MPLTAEQSETDVIDSVFNGKIVEFDSLHIKEYKSQSEYNYEQDAEYEENVLSKLLLKFLSWISEATGIKFGYGLFQFFKYLFLGIATYLMIRFFMNSSLGGVIQKKEEDLNKLDSSLVDADMSSTDLTTLIDEAEKRSDFRLSIRFNYLKLLRILDDKELIYWKAEKTNSDFIAELKSEEIKSKFVEITRLYEYIWYGEFEISSLEEYIPMKAEFNEMFKKLSK